MKREWLLVLTISLLTIFLALTPLWYAYSRVPEGYTMAAIGRDDEYGLFAWAKQAQQGHWLFWDAYSADSTSRQFINPFFWLLGKLSLVFNRNLVLTFNLARIGAGLFFLLTAYWFFSFFFESRRRRLAAFLMLCFSSGLGWLLFFIPRQNAWFLFNGVSSTEALSFPSLLFYPHFTFALGLMMSCFGGYLKFLQQGKWLSLLLTAIAGNLLIASHPHEMLVLGLAPGAYLFLTARVGRRHWLRTAVYWLTLAPMVVYFGSIYLFNPVYREFIQSPLARLSWPDFAGAYGLILLPASWGAYRILMSLKTGKVGTKTVFPLAWSVMVLALLLVPFNFQRKMVMGFHFPLIVLSVVGLEKWWQGSSRVRFGIKLTILLTLLFPQNLYFVRNVISEIGQEPAVYRLSSGVMAAQAWLETQTDPEVVVLANPAVGLVTPALSGRRVFLGHWGLTNQAEDKAEKLADFFQESATDKQRRELAEQYHLDYYWQDKEGLSYNRWVFEVERKIGKRLQELEGAFQPERMDFLDLVFENDSARIYRINSGS